MKVYDIILIAVALSIDAATLTIANCATYKKTLTKKEEWSMPIAFGLFQGLMPLLGYFVGSFFVGFLEGITGYISAGIFFILTLKIIIDLIKEKRAKNDEERTPPKFTFLLLIIQAIATSIDALAIGFTFSFGLPFSIFIIVGIIAVITFVIVTLSLFFGKYLSKLLGGWAEILGAAHLLTLAIQNLIEAII